MPLTTKELLDKAIDQRTRGRFEEALVSAIAASKASPDNADIWWQVALCRLALSDNRNAIPALERTVELAPWFALGWARLGTAYMKEGDEDAAVEALETALEEDDEQQEALEALADVYSRRNNNNNIPDEKELSILKRLEGVKGLSSFQLNRIGVLHYQQKNYFEAIKYWQQNAAFPDDPASLFNLGLVFNQPDVSQDADAIDMWRLCTVWFPDHQRSYERIRATLPRLLDLADNARRQGKTLLSQKQWYSCYINPFELLNPSEELKYDDFDAKTIQKLKKRLLQEIELEDGNISWMPETRIDKSKVIGVCEELNNEKLRDNHWQIFQNNPLLNFLTRGCHEHFLVDEDESPLDTIELLEDESNGFRDWLSEPFTKQYNLVLSQAIGQKNLIVLECLFDGRRWVTTAFTDKCFETARRQVDRLLQPLREACKQAEKVKPETASIRRILEHDSLVGTLNLLPTYFFRDFQNEAVSLVRNMAVSCYNIHSDSDQSRDLLHLTHLFHFKSDDLNHQLEDDFKKIEELIHKEREHEVQLTSGSENWKITKKGVEQGTAFLAVSEITSIRWGIIIRQDNNASIYDFLMAFRANNRRSVQFAWKATKDLEQQQKNFNNLIEAVFAYVVPFVVDKIETKLKDHQTVLIGSCLVSDHAIQFEKKGWISSKTCVVPWWRTNITIDNGEITVSDAAAPKDRISMPLRETENAPILQLLALLRKRNKDSK